MWHVIAIIGAALSVMFLAVMLLPLGAEVISDGGRTRWIMIFAGVHIPVPQWVIRRVKSRMAQKAEEPKEPGQKRSLKDLGKKLHGILNKSKSSDEGFTFDDLRLVLNAAVRLLKTLRVRVHRLHVVIASPDPAWTGMAYGMAWAIIGALPADWPVSVEADWTSAVPAATYDVQVTVIPAQVLGVVLGTIWKKVYA